MRLATANIWGLPTPLSWPPLRVRHPRIRQFLAGSFDIVALQEHWRFAGRPRHLDGLDLIVPGGHEGDSGLALKSRHRVLARAHGSFRNRASHPIERMWCTKGWQRATLDVDGARVSVINTHVEAHAPPRYARVRAAQVDELLEVAAQTEGAVVLAGDFNLYADVASDRESLARIEAAGFADAVAPFDPRPTYESLGSQERFDRVFVRGLACTAAHVDVGARLGDHRPVVVELQPRGSSAPATARTR